MFTIKLLPLLCIVCRIGGVTVVQFTNLALADFSFSGAGGSFFLSRLSLCCAFSYSHLPCVGSREAARECRRKKKEYVKCLENRVAVLENQNKTLIEELKALKDLYCHKTE